MSRSNTFFCQHLPNHQRTLNKLPTELRCQNFVTKHRLSIQIGTKHAKNVYAMCTYSDWASILHATVGGWVRIKEQELKMKSQTRSIMMVMMMTHLDFSLSPPSCQEKKKNKDRFCSKTCGEMTMKWQKKEMLKSKTALQSIKVQIEVGALPTPPHPKKNDDDKNNCAAFHDLSASPQVKKEGKCETGLHQEGDDWSGLVAKLLLTRKWESGIIVQSDFDFHFMIKSKLFFY